MVSCLLFSTGLLQLRWILSQIDVWRLTWTYNTFATHSSTSAPGKLLRIWDFYSLSLLGFHSSAVKGCCLYQLDMVKGRVYWKSFLLSFGYREANNDDIKIEGCLTITIECDFWKVFLFKRLCKSFQSFACWKNACVDTLVNGCWNLMCFKNRFQQHWLKS